MELGLFDTVCLLLVTVVGAGETPASTTIKLWRQCGASM